MTKDSEYLHLMNDVSPGMLTPDYWTGKQKNSGDVIMTEEEIKKFNRDILYEKAEHYRFLDLLKDGVDFVDYETLTGYIEEAEIIENAFFEDGTFVSSKYWDLLIENENLYGISDHNKLSYGFAVKRDNVYLFPTEDILTTDNPYTFFNDNQNSSILYGEPVIILLESKDRKWYFILCESFGGWILKDSVALCEDKKTWNRQRSPKKFLMVTDDKFTLEYDAADQTVSGLEVTMGQKLTLVPYREYVSSKEGRAAYGNFVVKIPVRDLNGMVSWHYAYVPVSRGVHMGYPEYTGENVLKLAFGCLGDRYGWGGQYHARDCSQYLMEIWRCFGISLPRNSSGFQKMNCKTVDVENLSVKEKKEKLDETPIGSILYLKGHVMLYLGKDHGRYYVISALSSFFSEESADVVTVQSVAVSTLDLLRKNGKTWLEDLSAYKIPQK